MFFHESMKWFYFYCLICVSNNDTYDNIMLLLNFSATNNWSSYTRKWLQDMVWQCILLSTSILFVCNAGHLKDTPFILKVSAVECWSISLMDPQSTLKGHLHRYSWGNQGYWSTTDGRCLWYAWFKKTSWTRLD